LPRNIYFSFHYQDVKDFRANVVRNSGKFRKASVPFRDGSIWEEAEEKKVRTIKSLIDGALRGTSVTCVLIGTNTYERRWVRYEIVKSFAEKKGLIGVGINWIRGRDGRTKLWPGENPFAYLKFKVSNDGKLINFYEYKETWIKYRDLPQMKNNHFTSERFGKEYQFTTFAKKYSYHWHDGVVQFEKWIEEAAENVGR
jgi:hypothetical protein